MTDTDFQLKGTALTVIVLQVTHYDAQTFPEQLREKIEQAPDFFNQAGVLIDLSRLAPDCQAPDVAQLTQQVRDIGMQPMAFKGVPASLADTVRQTGLASLPSSQQASSDVTPPKAAAKPAEPALEVRTVVQEKLVHRPHKLITRPVRAGQQVYAEGGDLICLAAVNEGAEVLADGNIHVYGPLRGRALAGVKGDQNARIFCQQIDAELVSVAGCFALSEHIDEELHRKAAQVHLADDTLRIVAL